MTLPPPRSLEKTDLWILLVVFTASGFAGLIYESIWSHYLRLFLGHAAYAQTTVLAIFMGGMALGAWLAARHSWRWNNPLLAYAVAEGVIGLAALVFHSVFVGATEFTFDRVLPELSSSVAVQAAKYLIASSLILPQSVLLGMTFPLMSGALLRRAPEQSGALLAVLYFANSLGAAIGALASGLYLIAAVGLPGTILTAGLLNVALAIVSWRVAKGDVWRQATPHHSTSVSAPISFRWQQVFLAVAFLTGLSSFLYEIGWIRMLALVLGSSSRAFELMLSAFVLGLALGGYWIKRRIDRLDNAEAFLGYVQIVMGLLAAATLPLYSQTFHVMQWALSALNRNEAGYHVLAVVDHGIAMAVMLPATFCAGMTLPLLSHILFQRGSGERAVGQVYAANTVGAIVGVMLAIHLLMPSIGLKGLIITGASIDVGLGVFLLYRSNQREPSHLWQKAGLVAAGLLLSVGVGYRLDPNLLTSGVFRSGAAKLDANIDVTFQKDGKTVTVALLRKTDLGEVSILTNGKADASINMAENGPATGDEVTMVMAGALTLAFQPQGKIMANIGMGSGLSTHVMLGSGQLQELHTVEIERFMVDAARQGFGSRVHRTFSDPRSHIHIEDAKTFFSLNPRKYDAILSEPSNPWVSGVASLFSREFFHHVKHHLVNDGILVQWLHLYESDMTLLASVLKAISAEFDDYRLYNTDNWDVIIVAKKRGILGEPNWNAINAPEIAKYLKRTSISSMQDIERRLIGDKRLLLPLIKTYNVPENSDYFPYLEQKAPRTLFFRSINIDLTNLGLAPLPYIEMLSHRERHGETYLPQPSTFYTRDERTRDALAILHETWAEDDGLRKKLGRSLKILEHAAKGCSGFDDIWLLSLHDVISATLPLLTVEESTVLLERWIPAHCMEQLPPLKRQWVLVYLAVANRRADALVKPALSLLSSGNLSNTDQKLYLISAAMLGSLASGQKEEAAKLWEKYSHDLPQNASLGVSLRLLAALTETNDVR